MPSNLPVLFTGLPVGHPALPSHIDQTKLKAALDQVEAELAASRARAFQLAWTWAPTNQGVFFA